MHAVNCTLKPSQTVTKGDARNPKNKKRECLNCMHVHSPNFIDTNLAKLTPELSTTKSNSIGLQIYVVTVTTKSPPTKAVKTPTKKKKKEDKREKYGYSARYQAIIILDCYTCQVRCILYMYGYIHFSCVYFILLIRHTDSFSDECKPPPVLCHESVVFHMFLFFFLLFHQHKGDSRHHFSVPGIHLEPLKGIQFWTSRIL